MQVLAEVPTGQFDEGEHSEQPAGKTCSPTCSHPTVLTENGLEQ